MSLEAEWKGRTDERLLSHSEYHKKHFDSIDEMKLELTKLQIKVGLFSLIGSMIGGGIISLVIAFVSKRI